MNRITSFIHSLSGQRLKHMVREAYAWPGGYTLIAVMSDGSVLCHNCVKSNYKLIVHSSANKCVSDWQLVDTFVHYEGESLFCDHCSKELPSEYGNPENDQ